MGRVKIDNRDLTGEITMSISVFLMVLCAAVVHATWNGARLA